MGQLTVGILFFKSPRPTGWLGKIGVRHWPHRFPSCGLNQLWLLASLSHSLLFSISPSTSLSLSIFFLFPFPHSRLYLFLACPRSLSFADVPLASASACLIAREQRTYFILFHFAADPTMRLISSGRRWIGRSEIVGICHWTRKSNGGRPLSLSQLDVLSACTPLRRGCRDFRREIFLRFWRMEIAWQTTDYELFANIFEKKKRRFACW